jgi:hypothetical protein
MSWQAGRITPAFNVIRVGDNEIPDTLALDQRGLKPGDDIAKFDRDHMYYMEDFRQIARELGLDPKSATKRNVEERLARTGLTLSARMRQIDDARSDAFIRSISEKGPARTGPGSVGRPAQTGPSALDEIFKKQLVLDLAQRGLPLNADRAAVLKFDSENPGYMSQFRWDCERLGLDPRTSTKADLDKAKQIKHRAYELALKQRGLPLDAKDPVFSDPVFMFDHSHPDYMKKFNEIAGRFGLDPITATKEDVDQAEKKWRRELGEPEEPSTLDRFIESEERHRYRGG